MANVMKFVRLGREYIKPSSPTPLHLTNFKLSLLDQLAPSLYASMVFFYPMQPHHDTPKIEANHRVQHLKKSLSPFLTDFYPFAGWIKDHVSIDCNDAGVEFSTAHVNTKLKHFLKRPNTNALNHMLPLDIESTTAAATDHHLARVQANTFECGGMALGICWSHKISDGGTVSAFMRGWSTMASCSANRVIPEYVASSLFPPMDSSIAQHSLKLDMGRTSTRRFVFDASKIAELKTRGATQHICRPTRVEVVSSLLWKCATKASRANSGAHSVSVMSQSMNIRRRTSPPLPDNTIGNLVGYYVAKMEDKYSESICMRDLVAKQRKGKTEAINKYAKKLQGKEAYSVIRDLFKEAGNLLRREDVDFFKCLSTCGDGLYDVDFGWGKPIWQSLVSLGYKNTFALNQTRDGGGIEAWVTLSEDDMAIFERDLELLAFASSNPSTVVVDLNGETQPLQGCNPKHKTMYLTW